MGFETQWRGQPDTTRFRFLVLVAVSFLLHLPVSPLALLVGLLGFARPLTSPDVPEPEPITAIPVDILNDLRPTQGDQAEEEERAALSDSVSQPEPPADPRLVPDAGIVDGSAEDADATLEDGDAMLRDGDTTIEDTSVEAGPEGGLGDSGEDAEPFSGDAGSRQIEDPVALTGSAASIARANAEVKLIIYTETLRGAPLGDRLGRLMANLPQWRDFFGPTRLNPVQAIDRIMLAGADIRQSTEDLVIVARYRVSEAIMRRAVSALVEEPGREGLWLDAGVPAATARADRAERVFVLPAPHVIVVAPSSARESALSLRPPLTFPPPRADEVLVGSLLVPHAAFAKAGVPLEVPRSIQYVRFEVTPTREGGARMTFVAKDASPEAARQSVAGLTEQIRGITTLGAGASALDLFSRMLGGGGVNTRMARLTQLLAQLKMNPVGDEIRGEVSASRDQVEEVLLEIEGWIGLSPTRRRPAGPHPSGLGTPRGGRPGPSPRTPASG